MSSTQGKGPAKGPFSFKPFAVKIHMPFQGANYHFEVLPEPVSLHTIYHILREGKVVFNLRYSGDTWIEESSGASTAFVQALGAAIRQGESLAAFS